MDREALRHRSGEADRRARREPFPHSDRVFRVALGDRRHDTTSANRFHRARHDGRADGAMSRQRRLRPLHRRRRRRARRRARCANGRAASGQGQCCVARRVDHDAAEFGHRRKRAARRRRGWLGKPARERRRRDRHEFVGARTLAQARLGARRARPRVSRCARVGRREESEGGHAGDSRRRQRGGARAMQARARGDGQEHSAHRRRGRGACGQGAEQLRVGGGTGRHGRGTARRATLRHRAGRDDGRAERIVGTQQYLGEQGEAVHAERHVRLRLRAAIDEQGSEDRPRARAVGRLSHDARHDLHGNVGRSRATFDARDRPHRNVPPARWRRVLIFLLWSLPCHMQRSSISMDAGSSPRPPD
ncbi:hypothetical protein NECAME_18847, partial [Necator americanus]